jgi:hypothetical protein
MRLSDLLGARVIGIDGRDHGVVTDVRLVQDGPILGMFGAAFRAHGLIVNRHRFGAHLGFDRAGVRGPWLLKRLFALVQGDPRYAAWDTVRSIEPHLIRIATPSGGLPPAGRSV